MAALARIRRVAVDSAELAPGAVLDDRYTIVSLIGEGGFGRVFAARDRLRDREVAVKVLTLAYDDGSGTAIARFVREAEITASLVHGNTIRVFDWGMTEGGHLFLIMELLRGESLRTRLDRVAASGHTLGDQQTRTLGIQILQSLKEAHAHGLVHRDLKPENIYLHRLGQRGEITKVIDFGVARRAGSQMTRVGQVVGTPTHMSPEQAQGRAVDGRSDLYSLGVILYQCLVGKLPYEEPSSGLLTMMMHVTAPLPDLLAEAPGPVTPSLAAVVLRALAKQPDERFADAGEMRAALKAVWLPRQAHVRVRDGLGAPHPPTSTPTPASGRRKPRPVSAIVASRVRSSAEGPPTDAPAGHRRAEGPTSNGALPPGRMSRRKRLLHAAETQRLDDRESSDASPGHSADA